MMHQVTIMRRSTATGPAYQARCKDELCGEVFGPWSLIDNAWADAMAHMRYGWRA